MGLDLVELAIEVEETFGLTIADTDAPTLVSVGQLYDYVLARLPGREAPGCLSATAFYRLRRGLIDSFATRRDQVRPSSPLETLIPDHDRRLEWSRLGEVLGWRLPSLVRPGWMTNTLFGLSLLASLGLLSSGWQDLGSDLISRMFLTATLALIGFLVPLAAMHLVTRPFATRIADGSETVRGVVQSALSMNYGSISRQGPGWNRLEVWEILRALISDQLGVPLKEVVPDAEFVRDFGAD